MASPITLATFTGASSTVLAERPNAAPVTLLSVDPDTGATLATAAGVTACRTAPALDETPVGDGGVPSESVTFRVEAAGLAFALKPRDRVVEADGTTWAVRSADLVVFRSKWLARAARTRG